MSTWVASTLFVDGPLPQVFGIGAASAELTLGEYVPGHGGGCVQRMMTWKLTAGGVPNGVVRLRVGNAVACGLADAGVATGLIGLPTSGADVSIETEVPPADLTDDDKRSLHAAYRSCPPSALPAWRSFVAATGLLPKIALDLAVHDGIMALQQAIKNRDAKEEDLARDWKAYIDARRALREAPEKHSHGPRKNLEVQTLSGLYKSIIPCLRDLDELVARAWAELLCLPKPDPEAFWKSKIQKQFTKLDFEADAAALYAVYSNFTIRILKSAKSSYVELLRGGMRWVDTIIASEVKSWLRGTGPGPSDVDLDQLFAPYSPVPDSVPPGRTSCHQVNDAIRRLERCKRLPAWVRYARDFLEAFNAATKHRKKQILAFALISVLERPATLAALEIQIELELASAPHLSNLSRWNSEAKALIRTAYLEFELLPECVAAAHPPVRAITSLLTELFGGTLRKASVARRLRLSPKVVRAELGGCLAFPADGALRAFAQDIAEAVACHHLSVKDAVAFVRTIHKALGDSSIPLTLVTGAGAGCLPTAAWRLSGATVLVVCRRCRLLPACVPDLQRLSPADRLPLAADMLSVVASMAQENVQAFLVKHRAAHAGICGRFDRLGDLFRSYPLLNAQSPRLLERQPALLARVLEFAIPAVASLAGASPVGAPAWAALSRLLGLSHFCWSEVRKICAGLLRGYDVALSERVTEGALCVRVKQLLHPAPGPLPSVWLTWLGNGDASSVPTRPTLSSIEFDQWFKLPEDRRRELLQHF